MRKKREGDEGSALLSGSLFLDGYLLFFALEIALTTTTLLNLIALLSHNSLYFADAVLLVSARNMKIRYQTINIYFLCFVLSALVFPGGLLNAGTTNRVATPKESGSQTNAPLTEKELKKKKKKAKSTLRVHLEVPRDGSNRNEDITVLRGNPMVINVEKEPILDQFHLVGAKVVQGLGGVEIELTFDSNGRTILQNISAANRGRRLAIGSDFDKKRRWLAAPMITRLLSDGTLRFTPDASPEEIEILVAGLINMAEIKKKKNEF